MPSNLRSSATEIRAHGAPLLLHPAMSPILLTGVLAFCVAILVGIGLLKYSTTVALTGRLVSTPGIIEIASPLDASLVECWVQNGTHVTSAEPLCRAVGLPTAINKSGELAPEALVNNAKGQLYLAELEADLQQKQMKLHSDRPEDQREVDKEQARLGGDKLSVQEQKERLSEESPRPVQEFKKTGFVSGELVALRELQHSAIVPDALDPRTVEQSIHRKIRERIFEQSEQLLLAQIQSAQHTARARQWKSDVRTATLESELYITAPRAGLVSKTSPALSAARRGDHILTIVPDGSAFEAHLLASSQEVGSIKVGDKVEITYSASDQFRYGKAVGFVTKIATTPLAEPLNPRESHYDVVVSLNEQTVVKDGQQYPLFEGMAMTGRILVRYSSVFKRLKDSVLGR